MHCAPQEQPASQPTEQEIAPQAGLEAATLPPACPTPNPDPPAEDTAAEAMAAPVHTSDAALVTAPALAAPDAAAVAEESGSTGQALPEGSLPECPAPSPVEDTASGASLATGALAEETNGAVAAGGVAISGAEQSSGKQVEPKAPQVLPQNALFGLCTYRDCRD